MDGLAELGCIAISETHPTGINIRYDDEFEFIEDELARQGSLIDRGQVKWDEVSLAAVNILTNKSKDLKVSCYLIRALYEQQGFKGLAAGLTINRQLLETFWDELYPLKDRARANAYEWLSSKFESVFTDLKADAAPDREALNYIEQSCDTIQKIEAFLIEKLSDKAPALGDLRRDLNHFIEHLRKKNTAQETQKIREEAEQIAQQNNNIEKNAELPAVNTPEKQAAEVIKNDHLYTASDMTFNASEVTSEKGRNKIFRHCHEVLRNVTAWSLTENLDSPSAYAINRFSTWMGINQLPMHNDNVTPLRPLPKDKINTYINLFNNANYQELIPQIEQSFSKSPFWLDAHRMVAEGLDALSLHESANQVREHVGIFIRRFPKMIDLKFSDNTDFADQQTKQWINREILSDNTNQSISVVHTDDDIDIDEVLSQANELVKQQKIKEAVQLFQNQISLQGSLKKQMFWKYHLARFCYDNAQYKMSLSLLKEIDRFLMNNGLESWEPDLVKNVVYLILLCSESDQERHIEDKSESTNVLSDDKHRRNELNQLYSRLCQLDPVLALDIK